MMRLRNSAALLGSGTAWTLCAASPTAADRDGIRRISAVRQHLSTRSTRADLRYISQPASDSASQASTPVKYPRLLYPAIEPFDSGYLAVGDGHKIYYDVSGNPNGVPVVVLHGGPGGGCSPKHRRFYDPSFYKIVIFDQRGSGKSVPNASEDLTGSLVGNTTQNLVQDIDKLRKHLGVKQWGLVQGGSWGSTLALAYAEAFPADMRALLLRGVFLFSPEEVDYLFSSGGTFGQNPQAWESYCKYIEDTSSDWDREKNNLLSAYWDRLNSDDAATRMAAACAFVGYELSISKTFIDPAIIEDTLSTPTKLIPFAVMEVLYMLNAGFMPRGQLLDNAHILAQHKHQIKIVHGRADYVCQPHAAWSLTKTLRNAGGQVDLEFVSGAGHSDSEPGIIDGLVRGSDEFRKVL